MQKFWNRTGVGKSDSGHLCSEDAGGNPVLLLHPGSLLFLITLNADAGAR